MSDLMSIGASGVRAYQTALGTVSDNIANVGTAGYARRSTGLAEVTAVSGSLTQGKVLGSNGVTLTGVGRITDTYKTQAVRSSAADLARTEAGATWLDRVQTALTGNQLGDRLTSFFTASTTLAADPTSSAARSTRSRPTSTAPPTTRPSSSTSSARHSPRSTTGSAARHRAAAPPRASPTSATR